MACMSAMGKPKKGCVYFRIAEGQLSRVTLWCSTAKDYQEPESRLQEKNRELWALVERAGRS